MPAKKTVKKVVAKKKVAKKKVSAPVKKATTPTTKKTAKKVSKKTAPKKDSHKTCSVACDAPEAFWVNNGPILHSLEDLLEALKTMTDEQYEYHTKRGENDFANWIQYCIKDTGCATSLRRVKTKSGALRVLVSRCSSVK